MASVLKRLKRQTLKNRERPDIFKIAETGTIGVANFEKYLTDNPEVVDKVNDLGESPLIIASRGGHLKIVRDLIKHGADINLEDNSGRTALMESSAQGHVEIVKELIEAGPIINATDKTGRTALMDASKNGHLLAVRLLYSNGEDINITADYGETALMLASEGGHELVVNALCKWGAKVNHRNQPGNTALMIASYMGHLGAANELLKWDADVNMKNKGADALMLAAQRGHPDVVDRLIKAGANINLVDSNGLTPLMWASRVNADVVEVLCKAGADIEASNKNGSTSLMFAAKIGSKKTIYILCKYGASINKKNNDGDTAEMIAKSNGYLAEFLEGIELCKDKKAKQLRRVTRKNSLSSAKRFSWLSDNLKYQSPDKLLPFRPSNAYYIGGHGNDSNQTFIVPENCIIVVKNYIGQVSYVGKTEYKIMNNICNINKKYLKNPLLYKDILVDNFGGIAIYRSGEKCPNFTYSLLSCFPYFFNKQCSQIGSGLINMDLINRENCFKESDDKDADEKLDTLKTPTEIRDYIMGLFSKSVYPTPNQVKRDVEQILKHNKTINIRDLLHKLKYINITQKELCEKRRGVYYNFVCRLTHGADKMYRISVSDEKDVLNASLNLKNKKTRKFLLKRIEEAATKRAPYIKGTKFDRLPEEAVEAVAEA